MTVAKSWDGRHRADRGKQVDWFLTFFNTWRLLRIAILLFVLLLILLVNR